MALIKAPEQKKVQLQEKKVVLDASTWRELNQYAKFAGIKGRAQDKVNYIVEQALLNVFNSDKAYAEFNEKQKVNAKDAPKTAATTTNKPNK